MMRTAKISKEDVRYVAKLARLNLSAEDMERFTLQLNSILSYMDKLNELDTSNVEPMSHVTDVYNAFRDDVVGESFAREVALENAPDTEQGFFKVPRIIGDEEGPV
jgi:aspartyl-tRNA(Asn)/glutamyl-tRNA(Gln) amidotransferase subunit C